MDDIKVLIADDNIVIRQGLRSLLDAEERITVVGEASTGAEAIQLMRKHPADIALMDIRMPVMNGMEATKAILEFRESLPIIAQTAFTFNYEAEKIRKAGCREVLSKPISPEALMECISTYFTV